uniref:Uncharacterized protein n=1 Tax=Cyclophora tenuis TaxID=216820 RepID=A0A7S1GRX5_CYCTE|mmetsp:Transcript_8749/g.14731  ORF Transcript_8749/g.14731 Transcript_8749/m.14731 type:complete len:360 (+) Transcript_8749:69-1148(+)
MSDAATFFAKKKKKKGFKGFNANKIDAASITSTVHVDAPALSTDTSTDPAAPASSGAVPPVSTLTEAFTATSAPSAAVLPATEGAPVPESAAGVSGDGAGAGSGGGGGGGEWDDEALAATYARKGAVTGAATTELLDMKALELKRREEDDVAERMRVEETKAALAAAREGMEREALRLKEEREKKEVANKATDAGTGPGTGRGGRGFGGAGGKWIPPHLRAGAGLSRVRMGAAMSSAASQKLDTQDENLFPDLAAADAILEQQKSQVAYKVTKKTPVGGGATWASRPIVKPEPKAEKPKEPEKPREEPKQPEKPKEEPKKETQPAVAPETAATTSAPAAGTLPKKKKKKKKDVSTFKSS